MKSLLFSLFALGLSYSAVAQNAGIGTSFPTNGKLVIKNSSSTSGLVVNDSTTGISFGESSSPLIGFNNYYRSGRKLMDDGFASYLYFNPGNGTLYYNNAAVTGTQGTAPTLTTRFSINKDGEVGIGVSDALAGLHLRGKSLLVDNSSGLSDITLTANTSAIGGMMELQNNTGIRTVSLRSGDGSGISGELIFYNNTGVTSTLELDGDYAATGRSRIIVDELQIRGGADFAENFNVSPFGTHQPQPGMLVSIDPDKEGQLMVSHQAYDKKVAGIISGAGGIKPGMMMGHKNTVADGSCPVAITGRVYVNAEALNAAIQPGDLLTTSSLPGFAMKATDAKKTTGAVIGKAMSALGKGKQGMVLVLLSVQ